MAMPYYIKLEVDEFRRKRPNSTLSDEAVYRHLKRRNPHLEWDEADKAYEGRECKNKWVKK